MKCMWCNGVIEIVECVKEQSFDEMWEFMVSEIVKTQKMIVGTAKSIQAWYDRVNAHGEQIKSIEKALVRVEARKGVLRDILKGEIGFYDGVFAKGGRMYV